MARGNHLTSARCSGCGRRLSLRVLRRHYRLGCVRATGRQWSLLRRAIQLEALMNGQATTTDRVLSLMDTVIVTPPDQLALEISELELLFNTDALLAEMESDPGFASPMDTSTPSNTPAATPAPSQVEQVTAGVAELSV
ncbi:hypothetical protein RhiJN_26733 [Ceratobasidium sp. AG-Ba]|nr:hypothetical protein RhiJN_12685 [Ceratobasidium sp. AG-Ba]QRV98714.1 hypothetical protein RhiJN_26733 [Ceratobasidium sp. AG-Ba]